MSYTTYDVNVMREGKGHRGRMVQAGRKVEVEGKGARLKTEG
jgi:hypothetical protein